MPFSLEVALGYLRSRPSKLVSSVSILSIGGIALGVAALVVAMGLLSGYRTEIQEKLIGANAEVVVFPLSLPSGSSPDTRALGERLARVPRVKGIALVIYQSGVASSAATPDGTDAVLKGVDPGPERAVSQLDAYLPGAESVLTPGSATAPPARSGAESAIASPSFTSRRRASSAPIATPGGSAGEPGVSTDSAPGR